MPLQKLVGNIYSVFIEILLWLIPIAGIAAGIYFGGEFRWLGVNPIIGFILGLIAGLLLDVILFGPVIIFFNIRSSLKNLENK